MADEIVQLDEFIKANLPDDKELIEKNISRLTAPGENYWSEMLKLDLVIKDKQSGRNENLNLVLKVVVSESHQADANIPMFKAEIKFYTEIIPSIQKFLKDRGVPELTFFPELFAARLNVDGLLDADRNAVLILENLKANGYENIDRHKGYDFDAAKVVLGDLAAFHAAPLAMRLLDPEQFDEKIKKNCFGGLQFKKEEDGAPKRAMAPPPFHIFREILAQDLFCRKNINVFDNFIEKEKLKFSGEGNPFSTQFNGDFTTLTHKDMRINNTMQYLRSDRVTKNKIIDFQMIGIDNPVNDLLFLLISSVEVSVLQNHFDYLLNFYHEKFIAILEACGCDTKPYAHQYFLENVKLAAIEKFMHVTIMTLVIIFAAKGHKVDFNNLSNFKLSDINAIAQKKLIFMFSEMVKRKWFE